MGFAQGFEQGFGLMDAYYTRKEEREYLKERRAMEKESHDIGMENAKRQGKLADIQLNEYQDKTFADQYAAIVTNDDGSPIDISKLSPEQVQQKKAQFTGFLNTFEPAKRFFTENPDVDPDQPLAGVDIVFDQKTKQPSAVFSLRMKDGRVAPLTELRSADQGDSVVVVPLADVDAQIRGALGSKMGLKATPEEYRKNKAATAAEDRKHAQALALEGVKHGNAMRLEAFKEGYSFDEKGNPVAPGGLGGLRGKKLDDEVKRMDSLLKTQYGSESMSGMFVLDGTGQQLSWAGVLGRQMLESGQAPNAHEAVARAMQIANDLKAAGGDIVWDDRSGRFLMFDGTVGEDGAPKAVPLGTVRAPQGGGNDAPRGGQKPADGKAAPTFEKFAADVRAANPGEKIPDEVLRARYESRFGGAAAEKKGEKPPAAEKPASTAAPAAPEEKPAPADPKPKTKPAEKGLIDTVKEKAAKLNGPDPENPSVLRRLLTGTPQEAAGTAKGVALDHLEKSPAKFRAMTTKELKGLVATGEPNEVYNATRELARRGITTEEK